LGCLVSGGGRSVLNLQDRIERGELPATIATVLSTRAGVPAIERARARGLRAREIDPQPRESLDDRVDQALLEADVELVVLAGYLRLFRVDAWRGRCINIHPALLPRHGGKGLWGHHVHQAVLAAGDAESGCTVHWVDAEYDHGATILQRKCAVLPGEDPDSLANRVFAEEIEALPEAIRRIAVGDASPAAASD
jgi:phosphoribosylglycinamide formyltransferase-1